MFKKNWKLYSGIAVIALGLTYVLLPSDETNMLLTHEVTINDFKNQKKIEPIDILF